MTWSVEKVSKEAFSPPTEIWLMPTLQCQYAASALRLNPLFPLPEAMN
jgi:hypothetical protein